MPVQTFGQILGRSSARRIAAAFALGAMGLMAGCETAEGYRQQMTGWQGRPSDDLLVQWGPPTSKSTLSDGREMWSYMKEATTRSEGYYRDETRQVKRTITDKDGKSREETISETYPVWQPPTVNHTVCNTRFVMTTTHRVDQVTFDGNGCVAPEQKG